MAKQVYYFYEGETEKKLLSYLKKCELIKAGKLKKHNLWQNGFETKLRLINKKDTVFFIIDTDKTGNKDIFIKNIETLKSHNAYFTIQHKNLEDELYFSCNKKNKLSLFQDFYNVSSTNEFKNRFIAESNFEQKLNNNDFDFEKLWSRGAAEFKQFLNDNHIKIDTACRYKP
ncbi:MAG: hypothetical protein PSN35_05305 [Candidatus Thioglobus sp.]|uniref:hypothetical protein n=1 Tax=Candidatus Thioglobus sp. TaxID=2026721 RepID=UPI00262F93C4|nr:hypothetical protein [Candidatus Thioglobus sp.]MDC9727232.1 hypothetical protein [Candidatus Thioglobus sp.]